jgi:hypothetical protein
LGKLSFTCYVAGNSIVGYVINGKETCKQKGQTYIGTTDFKAYQELYEAYSCGIIRYVMEEKENLQMPRSALYRDNRLEQLLSVAIALWPLA